MPTGLLRLTPVLGTLQSPLYGFRFVDAHAAYHTDLLHQSDRGVLLTVMEAIARLLSTDEREAVQHHILAVKGFPDLRLPSKGFVDLKAKATATETANLFACLPVTLMGVALVDRICDSIEACTGLPLRPPPHGRKPCLTWPCCGA